MPTSKISSLATIPDLASGDLLPVVDISDISLAPTGTNKKVPYSLFSSTLIASLNIGSANGVASLDSGGKIPTSQLPSSVVGDMQYQGTWNATTNTPTIPAASSTNKGQFYVVATAGTTTISGVNDWQIGDWIVSDGVQWDKIDNTDLVTMVAGRIGSITLTAADIAAGTFPGAIAGTSASFSGTLTANLFSGSGASISSLNASNIASGVLLSGFGGTGQTTYARGDFIYASAANTLSKLALGTAGKFIRTDGTDPSWQTLVANDIPSTLNATTHPTITLSSGTIAANAPNLISQTWNSSSNLFRALDINVTNTASSSTSRVLDLRSSNTSVCSVDIAGNITANTISCANGTVSSFGTMTAQVLIASSAIQGDGGLITGISASNVTLGVLPSSVIPPTLGATTFSTGATFIGSLTYNNAASTVFESVDANNNTTINGANFILSNLSAPAGLAISNQGIAGSTTYGYRVSAINSQGETNACSTVTTATGNASLGASNFNRLTWTSVAGAVTYKVYGRTSGSELLIATITAPTVTYDDKGVVTPSGALPSNPTGTVLSQKAWANQTGNVYEIKDSTGTVKFAINAGGAITIGGTLERIGATVDGGSSAPTTGTVGHMIMPYGGTVVGWTVMNYDSTGALVAASTTWDVKKASYSTNPTTATMIATGTKPNTSAARVTGSSSGDITGGVDWAVQTFSKGDIFEFNLSAIATAVKSTLVIYVKPS